MEKLDNRGTKTGRPAWVLAVLAFVFALAVVFHKVLFQPLTWVFSAWECDMARYVVPMLSFGAQELSKGHLPLWNPHTYLGTPYFGVFQAGSLYPPNWLILFLPMPIALNLLFLLHELLAGFSMYSWMISRKFHPLASWFAGMTYMFGGALYLHIFAGHLQQFYVMAWFPFVFLAVQKAMETKDPIWVATGMGFVSLQLLAGFPQSFLYSSLAVLIYVLASAWKDPERKWSLISVMAVFLGAGCLTAIQIGAGWDAVHESLRGNKLPYGFVETFSFPPENFLKLILPDLFQKGAEFQYGRAENFWETTPYIGTVALFLALYALFVVSPKLWRMPLVLGSLFGFLAMGSYTPIFPFLYDHFPGVAHMRVTDRYLFVFCAFMCYLTAMGLDQLFRQTEKQRARTTWVLLGMGLFSLLLAFFCFVSPLDSFLRVTSPLLKQAPGSNWTWQEQFFIGLDLLLCGSLCLGASALFHFLKDNKKRTFCLALLGSIELISFAYSRSAVFEWKRYESQISTISRFLKEHPGIRVQGSVGQRVQAAGGYDLWGCDSLIPDRYYHFLAFSQGASDSSFIEGIGGDQFLKWDQGLFRLLGDRYVIMEGEKGLRVAEFPGKLLPRFKLFSQWEEGTDREGILRELEDVHFPFDQKVILEETPVPAPEGKEPRGKVEVVENSTDQIEVKADLQEPALLVFSENYTEGWKARALSDSAQLSYRVIPADYILKAVPLSAGHHHFVVEYRPAMYVAGKWISLAALFLYIPWVLWSIRSRRAAGKINAALLGRRMGAKKRSYRF